MKHTVILALLLTAVTLLLFTGRTTAYAASTSAVEEEKTSLLTMSQMDTGKFLLNELARLGEIQGKCHFDDATKNETCLIHVDQEVNVGFVHQRIKFDASVSAQVDLKAFALTLQVTVDNKYTYTHVYSLEDLAQVCYPFFEVLKLCVDFSDIKFSVPNNCFMADMHVDVRLLTLKLNLLTQHISFHQDKCQTVKAF